MRGVRVGFELSPMLEMIWKVEECNQKPVKLLSGILSNCSPHGPFARTMMADVWAHHSFLTLRASTLFSFRWTRLRKRIIRQPCNYLTPLEECNFRCKKKWRVPVPTSPHCISPQPGLTCQSILDIECLQTQQRLRRSFCLASVSRENQPFTGV